MRELLFGFKNGFIERRYTKSGILVDRTEIEVGECLDFATEYVEERGGQIVFGIEKIGLFDKHYVVKEDGKFVDPSNVLDEVNDLNFSPLKIIKKPRVRKKVKIYYNRPYSYTIYKVGNKKILLYIALYPVDILFGGDII